MSLQTVADTIKSRLGEAGSIGASVKFDCGCDGVVVIDGSSVTLEEKQTDCTVRCSSDVLRALIAGEINATAAFIQGKLKIEGDMSVAMRLSQIL